MPSEYEIKSKNYFDWEKEMKKAQNDIVKKIKIKKLK